MDKQMEELSEWLDNPLTQQFRQDLETRRNEYREALANGQAYKGGHPFETAELSAALISRISQLDEQIYNLMPLSQREGEDESDGDTASGPSPVGTAG